MDIICDTHIWYYIGNGTIDTTKVSSTDRLIATFNNIDELSRTPWLVDNPDYARGAIQAMFKHSRKNAIFEPPLVYLKKLAEAQYQYDVRDHHNAILEFTELIANGHDIERGKSEAYRDLCEKRKLELKTVANYFNTEAQKRKLGIKNKAQHRKEDSIPLNRKFISFMVAVQTDNIGVPDSFDWSKIELFETTLKVVFNALETGSIELMANDLYDLFLLTYVTPDKKVWTREKKWIKLIDDAGMSKYRYEI